MGTPEFQSGVAENEFVVCNTHFPDVLGQFIHHVHVVRLPLSGRSFPLLLVMCQKDFLSHHWKTSKPPPQVGWCKINAVLNGALGVIIVGVMVCW